MNTYKNILTACSQSGAELVAVSKTKPVEQIMELYDEGQRVFGENKVQELVEKQAAMPKDIKWHLIGHLQTNKVKYIAPFVDLIHAVDSLKLLKEINKQALKNNRIIDILIQIKIAVEESKFGLDKEDAIALFQSIEEEGYKHVRIRGLMGMATFTDDKAQIKTEFETMNTLFQEIKSNLDASKASHFNELSMGMSGDYELALQNGSTMVRIGSLLFGARNY